MRPRPRSDSHITCVKLIASLADYRGASLRREAQATFEHHLAGCTRCLAYWRSYEKTIRLVRVAFVDPQATRAEDFPGELAEAILAAAQRVLH
jgi:hypothetical protein